MLWILPGNVQAPDYFLIKSVCVLVIYKRLALIFSRSCALSDDILIFHKHRIRWGGCVYVFLILHRIPATLKLVFFFFFPLHHPFIFLSLLFFSWHCSSLNCCQICDPIARHCLRQKKRAHDTKGSSFVCKNGRMLEAGRGNNPYKRAWCVCYFG